MKEASRLQLSRCPRSLPHDGLFCQCHSALPSWYLADSANHTFLPEAKARYATPHQPHPQDHSPLARAFTPSTRAGQKFLDVSTPRKSIHHPTTDSIINAVKMPVWHPLPSLPCSVPSQSVDDEKYATTALLSSTDQDAMTLGGCAVIS